MTDKNKIKNIYLYKIASLIEAANNDALTNHCIRPGASIEKQREYDIRDILDGLIEPIQVTEQISYEDKKKLLIELNNLLASDITAKKAISFIKKVDKKTF